MPNNNGLASALANVATALVPVILSIVRDHQAATGTLPTDAEVQAKLDAKISAGLVVADDFLARTSEPS